MFLFRRLALLLALSLLAAQVGLAQSSSSSTNPANPPQEGQAQQPAGQNQGPVTVQGRIRARREQRRAQSIRDVYQHLYEVYGGMGYLRFTPGPNLQRVTYYAWDTGVTRYYSERLGVTIDGRGYYGTPYVGLNFSSITRPAVSTYMVMGGPTYRFYLQPKYSISGRVMGGYAKGNFSGDTNGFGGKTLGLWADSSTYAVNGAILGEYNLTPAIGFRLTGDYVGTGFGSTMQNNFGFTGGIVYRFGKQ
ncbi:MAG TPA: hypothetical protein VGG85_20340 [Terracidiphilus sp.]|jgi:hypothetical protein